LKNFLYRCPCCGLKIYKEKKEDFNCQRCDYKFRCEPSIDLKDSGPCRWCIHWNQEKCTYEPLLPLSIKTVKFDRKDMDRNDGEGCECFDGVL